MTRAEIGEEIGRQRRVTRHYVHGDGNFVSTRFAGVIQRAGIGWIASPAWQVRGGEPFIGEPIQAVFSSAEDAAAVLL